MPILPMSCKRPADLDLLELVGRQLERAADGDGELGGALRVARGVRILGLDRVDQRAQHLEVAALDGEQQLAVVGVVLIELLRRFVEGARQLRDLGRPLDGHADAERAAGEAARAVHQARDRRRDVAREEERDDQRQRQRQRGPAAGVRPGRARQAIRVLARLRHHQPPAQAPERRVGAEQIAPVVGEVGDDGERVPARRAIDVGQQLGDDRNRRQVLLRQHAVAVGMRDQPPAIVDDVGDAAPPDARVLDEILHAPQAHLRRQVAAAARGPGQRRHQRDQHLAPPRRRVELARRHARRRRACRARRSCSSRSASVTSARS